MSSVANTLLSLALETALNKHRNIPEHPKNYHTAVKKLFSFIKISNTLSKIRQLFHEFSAHYTMFPELWKLWLDLEEVTFFPDFVTSEKISHQKKIILLSKNHFIFEIDIDDFKFFPLKDQLYDLDEIRNSKTMLKESINDQKKLEKAMCIPHKRLEQFGRWMDYTSLRPIPQKILKRHREALKKEINRPVEGNYEKWITSLEDVDDPQFLIDNVEYELGKDPNNSKLWMAYVGFLNSLGDAKILNAYSRLCRIFTENHKMKTEYLNVIRKFESSINVTKFWIDAILFECKFGTVENAKTLLTEALEKFELADNLKLFAAMFTNHRGISVELFHNYKLDKYREVEVLPAVPANQNVILYKTFKKTSKQQLFSFSAPIIHYIATNSLFVIKQKLFQSCKYFYSKYGKRLCHRLTVGDKFNIINRKSCYISQSMDITIDQIDSIYWNNLVVTNYFAVSSINKGITSLLLKRIQVKSKFILFINQCLTFNELSFLKSPNLHSVEFENVTISDSKDLSIKTLIEYFMDVEVLAICYSHYISGSSESLALIKSNASTCKLKKFYIGNVSETFLIFIKNNFFSVGQNSAIHVTFAHDVPLLHKNNFESTLKSELKLLPIDVMVK